MSNPTKVDFIIVGQGLAGSAVALQLLKRRRSILVIDRISPNSPSRIAVGLFNPITGRHSIKTWFADQLFPYFHDFYRNAEIITGEKFFYPVPLYKPFASIEQQNEWMSKSADSAYSGYIQSINMQPTIDLVKDPFGGMMLKQSGNLDTIAYLKAVRDLVRKQGIVLEEEFDESLLKPGDQEIRYKDYRSEHIIFCQGLQAVQWFQWVPILPLKGETIRIRTDHSGNIIINRGVYAVPVNQNGTWRVGATYSWTDKTSSITEEARTELSSKLDELVTFQYEIVDQDWGIRPTTHDRRPILGTHPQHRRMHILNGLGPKGVSIAPYFSDILLNYIENANPLNKQVNLERYKSLYWSPSTRL